MQKAQKTYAAQFKEEQNSATFAFLRPGKAPCIAVHS